ncbi:DUF1648 domain-containing protein [Bacillus methanolicus]|uniref:DUF1648 domain-containing protein n=1 Tax=Bacillus methanolicus (strain MGA3 / ATCC 53907) TaxID=796606 RepID=I3E3Z0_BACMM|nr:DUF5808 domain-containing protein [Bacillus methanolicus]AIE58686.1 hypothetical protein BMMGA3_00980 [Bacillus methanolicus MGA3]EIJ81211.1 hypothetical protein MGA3_13015 [Bacillus methanolicus MGA3]
MILPIFLIIIGFITILKSAIPFLLKRTIAFGVTIPEGHTDDRTIASYKRIYSTTTLLFGLISLAAYFVWAKIVNPTEEKLALTGLAIQFCVIFVSMGLYFIFHAKTTRLKRDNNWGANLKQVKIADISIRTKDEMLPAYVFSIPMVITVGLIGYTAMLYDNIPNKIPIHWAATGQPDAFTLKTPFSSISLLVVLIIIQVMMLGINEITKKSGINISATRSNASRVQQLSFRKYSSWFLFPSSVLLTVLFSFLQLTSIHEGIGNKVLMFAMPLFFLLASLIAAAVYAFKVGQSGSRINVVLEDEPDSGITDVDDDKYWKSGIFYVNKEDPSIFVEKRFGIGWTINLAHPIGYLILFGPLLLILLITYLL